MRGRSRATNYRGRARDRHPHALAARRNVPPRVSGCSVSAGAKPCGPQSLAWGRAPTSCNGLPHALASIPRLSPCRATRAWSCARLLVGGKDCVLHLLHHLLFADSLAAARAKQQQQWVRGGGRDRQRSLHMFGAARRRCGGGPRTGRRPVIHPACPAIRVTRRHSE